MIPHLAEVCSALPEPVAVWLHDVLDRAAAGDRRAFIAGWSTAGRRLGHAHVGRDAWATDEAGRALLLERFLATVPPEAQASFVLELYEKGELGEQQALLRTLAFLPDPQRFIDVATAAMRSNALALLEAIACDNAYPAAHLPDGTFNQLVLKAMFNGLAVSRLVGLERRRNPELTRMVSAWVSERRAAGRPVPADVGLFLAGEANAPL